MHSPQLDERLQLIFIVPKTDAVTKLTDAHTHKTDTPKAPSIFNFEESM